MYETRFGLRKGSIKLAHVDQRVGKGVPPEHFKYPHARGAPHLKDRFGSF